MATFKTIHNCNTLLGGHAYRVTSNGETARIQCRPPTTSRFKTEVEMSMAEYQAFAEDAGLDDPYRNNNPAVFEKLIIESSPQH